MRQHPSIVICRGCCCGTDRKHPDTDHDQQLKALRSGAPDAHMEVVDCLDVCESSNVAVVRPSTPGRRKGGRAIWFGRLLTPEDDHAIASWVAAGGPGIADLPRAAARLRMKPPRDAKR